MPDKEEPVKEKMPKSIEVQQHPLHASWQNPWVILASVLVLAFLLLGAFSFHRSAVLSVRPGFGAGGPGMAGRSFSRDGGHFNSNSTSTRVTGVVTAVNGNTLTVAGDGTTHSVVTSSSTQYSGASSAVVDDTIVAIGTTSGSAFNATNVIVNP